MLASTLAYRPALYHWLCDKPVWLQNNGQANKKIFSFSRLGLFWHVFIARIGWHDTTNVRDSTVPLICACAKSVPSPHNSSTPMSCAYCAFPPFTSAWFPYYSQPVHQTHVWNGGKGNTSEYPCPSPNSNALSKTFHYRCTGHAQTHHLFIFSLLWSGCFLAWQCCFICLHKTK